ncbi:OTU domain-containing protein [Myxococcus hansupus]|uniref:OTU domain-containing protein n=1 Tax=Pseudomyxococcus hansupus TaxID=1297742 RepID=UPI0011874ADE|nr:hypothetical protein [Myxococcus hansupus]
MEGLYTRAETYGVLWRKDRIQVSLEDVKYLRDHAKDAEMKPVVFDKREPLVVPIQVLEAEGAPRLGIIPWHAPAPSTGNSAARAKDFPAFIQYCQQARKAQHLEVLLSDLNVDTEKPRELVEHCDIELSWGELFTGIRGPNAPDTDLLAHNEGWSTLPKSKFRPWAVNDVDVAKRLSPSWSKSIEQLKEQAGSMEPGPERSGLESSAKWMSGFTNLLDALKKRMGSNDFEPAVMPKSGKLVPQRFGSPKALLGHIESFASPPQRRFGASAYDKICPISTQSGTWQLVYQSGFVVPFPHAFLYADEPELLFMPEASLPVRVRPWVRLLEGSEEGRAILDELRPKAKRPAKNKTEQERYEALMAAARNLSDHMPVVADLLLMDTSVPLLPVEEKPFVPVPIQPVPKRIEDLCANYEAAPEGSDRDKALSALLEGWGGASGEERNTAATRRVEGALQHHEAVSEARDKTEDLELRHTSRKQKALPGKASNAKKLTTHLAEQHQHVVPNLGGGDCLFRSLAQLVFGDESRHAEIRQAVVNHLEDLLAGQSLDAGNQVGPESLANFRQAMQELLDWHRAEWPEALAYQQVHGISEWQQYLLGMRHAGEWGDLIAISAASHLFGVRFRVHARLVGGAFWTDEVNFVNAAQVEVREYTLLNSGNYHFELVLGDDVGALGAGFVATPPGWGALAVARRLVADAPVVAKSSHAMDVTQDEVSSPSTVTDGEGRVLNGKASHGAKLAHAPVILWDSNFHWQLVDAVANPDCLFVFGENEAWKKTPPHPRQTNTQALLRQEPNAIGLRTCWKPSARPLEKGNMVEGEHAVRNVPAITEDLDEVMTALKTKKFRALVIPWDMHANSVALGIGVANLPGYAPSTYKFLNAEILKLIDWAKKHLGTVQVLSRNTGLVPSVAQSHPKTLFIDETSEAMRHAGPPDGSSSFVLGAEDNILRVSTLLFPGAESAEDGLLTDDTEQDNVKRLDRDFDDIEQKIKSGHFHSVSVPADSDGKFILGEQLGRLKTSAPKTWQHLESRLQRLVELCEATRVVDNSASGATTSLGHPGSGDEAEAFKRKGKRPSGEWGGGDVGPASAKRPRKVSKLKGKLPTDAFDDESELPEPSHLQTEDALGLEPAKPKQKRKRSSEDLESQAQEDDEATQEMDNADLMQDVAYSQDEEEEVREDDVPVPPPKKKKSRIEIPSETPPPGDEEEGD